MKKQAAAFFDFDLTITNYDSFRAFLTFLYFRNVRNIFYLPLVGTVILLKKFNMLSLYQTKRLLLVALKRKSREEIERLAAAFLGKYCETLLNVNALKCIEGHISENIPVFIVSSSPNVMLDLIEAKLNITASYANELRFVDNRFTGHFCGRDCYGENKADLMREIASEFQIDLNSSFAYSDHQSDIPMLMVVGHPVAVNPDSGLKAHAREHGWEIEWWHE